MRISSVGVDLAKNIFQVHAETADGQVVFNRALRRGQVLAFFERLDPCPLQLFHPCMRDFGCGPKSAPTGYKVMSPSGSHQIVSSVQI